MKKKTRQHERGQAVVEYMTIVAVIVFAFSVLINNLVTYDAQLGMCRMWAIFVRSIVTACASCENTESDLGDEPPPVCFQ